MKRSVRHYLKKVQHIRLSDSEHQVLRSQLADFIATHPAPEPQGMTLSYGRIFNRSFATSALVLLILLSGTGISYAAEASLPGTMLYPVKVNVLEPIRGAVALSPEARVQWEVTKIERRLNEAEQLLGNGSFTAEAGSSLAERLQDNSTTIAQAITVLKTEKNSAAAASASNGLTAILQAHTGLLTQLVAKSKNPGHAEQLLAAITLNTQSTKDESESIAGDVSQDSVSQAQAAAHGIGIAAENTINATRKLYNKTKKNLDVGSVQQIDQYLSQLDSLSTEARLAATDARYSDAFLLFQEVQRKAKEATSILGQKKGLKGKLRLQLKPETQVAATSNSNEDQIPKDKNLTIEVLTPEVTENQTDPEGRSSRIRRLVPSTVLLGDLELGLKEKGENQEESVQ